MVHKCAWRKCKPFAQLQFWGRPVTMTPAVLMWETLPIHAAWRGAQPCSEHTVLLLPADPAPAAWCSHVLLSSHAAGCVQMYMNVFRTCSNVADLQIQSAGFGTESTGLPWCWGHSYYFPIKPNFCMVLLEERSGMHKWQLYLPAESDKPCSQK